MQNIVVVLAGESIAVCRLRLALPGLGLFPPNKKANAMNIRFREDGEKPLGDARV